MGYIKHNWGYELVQANTKYYFSRLLIMTPNTQTSYIYHKNRHITVSVVQGQLHLVIENRRLVLNTGESKDVPAKIMHQFLAVDDVTVLETGTALEDDIVVVKK